MDGSASAAAARIGAGDCCSPGGVVAWWDHRLVLGHTHAGARRGLNFARRQQFRRLFRAGRLGLAGITVAVLGMLLLSVGFVLPGGLLLAVGVMIGFRANHWLSLAGRSRVDARSEEAVRHALEPLPERGWRLRHGVRWPGGGDIDVHDPSYT